MCSSIKNPNAPPIRDLAFTSPSRTDSAMDGLQDRRKAGFVLVDSLTRVSALHVPETLFRLGRRARARVKDQRAKVTIHDKDHP